jgi:N-acetyl-anhydromuramyl-L-alanine amidase AmpD
MKPAHLCLILALAFFCPSPAEALVSRAHTKKVAKPKPPAKAPKTRRPQADIPELDPAIIRQLQAIPVHGNWKYIVIHHSGTSVGTPKALDRFHRQRGMENGLAYHFIIGNGHGMQDGQVFIGNRWKHQLQGGHLASEELNQVSIGICLIGNFDHEKPTPAQMATLQALLKKLRCLTGLPSSAITTHRLIHPKHTDCPGKYFPSKSALLLTQR